MNEIEERTVTVTIDPRTGDLNVTTPHYRQWARQLGEALITRDSSVTIYLLNASAILFIALFFQDYRLTYEHATGLDITMVVRLILDLTFIFSIVYLTRWLYVKWYLIPKYYRRYLNHYGMYVEASLLIAGAAKIPDDKFGDFTSYLVNKNMDTFTQYYRVLCNPVNLRNIRKAEDEMYMAITNALKDYREFERKYS